MNQSKTRHAKRPQLVVRCDPDLIEAVRAERDRRMRANPGQEITCSDVVRTTLLRALQHEAA